MKNITKILSFIFVLLINYFSVNADFIICDSWNINIYWTNMDDICAWWYKSNSISWIESFTWNYLYLNTWYWWNNNNYDNLLNIYPNLPIWFFDINMSTVIKNINPEYVNQIWYLWSVKILEKNINLDKNLPVWFFDSILSTNIKKTNPEYVVPVWFFWNIEKNILLWWNDNNTSNSGSLNESGSLSDTWSLGNTWSLNDWISNNNSNNQSKKITIKEFYINLFKKYTVNENDEFINNIVNLLLKYSYKNDYPFISDIEKNRIELYVEKSNFWNNIKKISKNILEINYYFKNSNNDNYKFYLLNYYLNK